MIDPDLEIVRDLGDRDTKRNSTGERRKDANDDDNNDVVCVGTVS